MITAAWLRASTWSGRATVGKTSAAIEIEFEDEGCLITITQRVADRVLSCEPVTSSKNKITFRSHSPDATWIVEFKAGRASGTFESSAPLLNGNPALKGGFSLRNRDSSVAHRPIWAQLGGALPAAPVASPPTAPPTVASPALQPKMMIFGGDNHTTYLGCVNCSEYAIDSVRNAYGPHGSPYSQESIFNHYGPFGSPYSSTSACDEYASDPPVIVDQNGRYYGRLTLNTLNPEIGIGAQLLGWLAATCRQ